ncbi:MAG: hypothetical protein A2Z21_04245 [Candidatus Fraserbacteria bacterium RBG_16_55_9]|uniref:SpoVT-AbrB domain-containing protein n=1 Tax=Fraserbacteria sp. (strain RBG_16_55_9) TaxID=1817864 RepID=A0A1F5UP19_FRAXR|nr:MAG: hypothetical protein A2Z21_04245 [Candidatus Fraserbacteria bacterium RBG_16_55_9]
MAGGKGARNLVRIGNSEGVILPSHILRAMGVTPETRCEIRIVGPKTIQIQFVNDRDAAVIRSIAEFVTDYREDLQSLAKK